MKLIFLQIRLFTVTRISTIASGTYRRSVCVPGSHVPKNIPVAYNPLEIPKYKKL